jgi:hypothetical protein
MTPNPESVDLDGHVDEKGIQYIGNASRQPNGKWICLANVEGNLCRVEVIITGMPPTRYDRLSEDE